ncbi:MAG TPA: CARDB domain-containing protein, partial [Vicinamibacterales bacterium]|nr:CARDB domain-containing protein [Vicinamibacterales bacterium]
MSPSTTRNTTRLRVALAAALATVVAAISITFADPASPVTMTNVATPSPVISGGELTYTITMVNTGGAKINDVVLNDQFNGLGGIGVPPQLQIATTRGSCLQTINGVTCQFGTIEGNGTTVVTIRGQVLAAAGTILDNTATVTGTKAAQNFTTTTTTHVLVTGNVSTLADLTMTKTGPTTVVVSTPVDPSPMTYTLTVNNRGLTNATDVVVVDTLPDGLTGITATGTSLFQCAIAGQTVTCFGGAVNAGANATITINAIAPQVETALTNTAVVDPDDQIPEGNELNNISALVNTQVVSVPPVDPLSINITDDPTVISGAGPDPVVPGGNVTFKMFVTNNASTRADDVMIVLGTQSLDAASVMVSNPPIVVNGTIGQSGGCSVSATEAKCLVRTLNPGGTILMSVTGRVIGFAGSSFISTASVTGNIKNQGVSSTDTELTTIKPYTDLTITKKDSPDPVCARSWPGAPLCGGGLKYLLTIGNSGMNAATNVVVRDPLPAGTILDSYTTTGGFTCTVVAATNVLTCTGGTIPAESTKQIAITLVAPPYVGSISNTATVDPNNAIFESDDTNNTGSATTIVSTGIDLSVTKSVNHNPVATSGTLIYTIVVENNGPQDATNIRLRDTLPSGTIFRDIVQITNGFTCSYSGGTLECIGGSVRGTMSESYAGPNAPPPLGPDSATIKFRIFAQTFEGTLHNEVRVDPLNEIAEIDENNNIFLLDTGVIDNGPGAFNDLEIKKEGSDTTTPGGPISYTIKVWNTGSDPAVNVTVRDVLPAGVTFVSATDGGGPGSAFTCAYATGVVNCTGATIAANTDETTARKILISVNAPNQIIVLTNEVFVDPDNAIPEGSERDNTATKQTSVESLINLIINKTGPPTSSQSQPGQYVITIKNDAGTGAGQTAPDVQMHDPMPVGVIPLAWKVESTPSPDNWACQIAMNPINVVDCQGDLAPNQTVKITIDVFMTAETGKSLENEACVDPNDVIKEFGPGESDNCSTHVTVVVPKSPNLTLTKSASPSSVTAGVELVYTLLIQNVGDATAVGLAADGNKLKVTDSLPSAVTFGDANGTDT